MFRKKDVRCCSVSSHAEHWCGHGRVSPKPVPHNGMVIEGDDGVCEDLVGTAPFAGDQYDITGPGIRQGGLDGDLSVDLDPNLTRTSETGQQVVNDLIGILGSRAAERHDDAIGAVLGDLGKLAALGSVAVSLCAHHEMNTPRGDCSQSGQRFGDVVRALCDIDANIKILALGNSLKMP